MTLTVLFSFTVSIGQVQVIDSGHVSINKQEFKHIIDINIEKNDCDSISRQKDIVIMQLNDLVANRDLALLEQHKMNVNLVQLNELERPAFFDKFKYGFGVGVATTIVIYLLKR